LDCFHQPQEQIHIAMENFRLAPDTIAGLQHQARAEIIESLGGSLSKKPSYPQIIQRALELAMVPQRLDEREQLVSKYASMVGPTMAKS
jgi:hypothetical protein